MLADMIRYIRGYVRIRITGYSPERFLNACSHRGIYVWGIRPVSGAYEMYISIHNFRKLKPVIKKTGTRVRIVGKYGLPFLLHQYRKRKLFFLGGILCIVLIILMSGYIWSIDISGNLSRTDDTLLKYLETKDVKRGMDKSDVDCARIVKDLRKEYDDIIWVSASIQGSRLIIQIKENEDADLKDDEEEKEPDENGFTTQVDTPTDLVADTDCVITEMIVRNGITMVAVGDEVKKGDILVTGQVPVNNDAGEVIDYQYHEADADIWGRALLQYQDEMEITYEKKQYQKQENRFSFYLQSGSYCVEFLPLHLKEDQSYERYTEEHCLKIGDAFYLPLSYGIKRAVFYKTSKEKYTKEEIQEILTGKFTRYCRDLEKKGVEIIENNVKIYTGSNIAEAKGEITVITPVGKKVLSELQEITAAEEQEESGE